MRILVIRLSSLGDVLLTTPVLRCLKKQLPHVELHLATRPQCAQLIANNPYIDKIIEVDKDFSDYGIFKGRYDWIVDLHNNRRSKRIRKSAGEKTKSVIYRKENLHKFIYIWTKINVMSGMHVVDRYMHAVSTLGVKADNEGLDLFLDNVDRTNIKGLCDTIAKEEQYVVFACGAQHSTKRIPPEKLLQLAEMIDSKVLLLGDKNDRNRIDQCSAVKPDNVLNLCGETTLMQSAAIVEKASAVVTPDSVMMHISAALRRPVFAIWGATAPSFGFTAFRTDRRDFVAERLWCHPCSRMGSERCPLGHFKCMEIHDWAMLAKMINSKIKK